MIFPEMIVNRNAIGNCNFFEKYLRKSSFCKTCMRSLNIGKEDDAGLGLIVLSPSVGFSFINISNEINISKNVF